MTRQDDLEQALDLAVRMLGESEFGDSRACSDEFVALAAILVGIGGDAAREIISAARARERASRT